MFHVPEQYRLTDHPTLHSDASYGNNGAFEIPLSDEVTAFVIASDGMGWEHVSVHVVENGVQETPEWDEMCKIKNMFWDKKDCVVQYHPPESSYVNRHEHTLHLWRKPFFKFPMPPIEFV